MVVLHEYSCHKIYYIIIVYVKWKICRYTGLEEPNFYSYVFYRLYVCYRLYVDIVIILYVCQMLEEISQKIFQNKPFFIALFIGLDYHIL